MQHFRPINSERDASIVGSRKRRRREGCWPLLSVLLAIAASFDIGPGFSTRVASAENINDILPHLHQVYRDDFIEIRSDVAVPNATALAARIKEAYRFDAKMQGFDFDSAAFKKSYTVGLASMRLAKKFGYGSGGGAALDSDTYVCHIFLYPYKEVGQTTWDGITASTTAHELEHSLMMRANSYDLPVYINEGIACSLGDRYANLTHEGDSFLKDMAKLLAKCTKADAEHVVRHFRVDKDFDNFKEGNKLYQAEQLGGMFIEFLAARVVKSAPKFFLKWGKVASSLGAHQYKAPNNRSFRQAFKKEFGLSLAQAEAKFLKHIETTEGNALERLKGTVYEPFADDGRGKTSPSTGDAKTEKR